MKVLEFSDVTKKFGNTVVLKKVSFEIDKGEFVGMIGENAAGKTTIAKMASGLLKPSSGDVFVFNHKPYKEFKIKKKIGFATHNPLLYPELTVYENLKFYGSIYDVNNVEHRIKELLNFFDLEKVRDREVRTLSRGFKQRVAVARALINEPDLLILDEVTTGLDSKMRQTLLQYLFNLKAKTILFVTHYESEIENCDRVFVVKEGVVFEKGV